MADEAEVLTTAAKAPLAPSGPTSAQAAGGGSGPTWSDPITLAEPIKRGDTEIASIRLRKPKAGELRGLSLQDVLTTDVTALLTLIPRISEPPLIAAEVDGLDPADLTECGGAIRGFFMTAAEKQVIEHLIAEHQPQIPPKR